MRRQRYLTSSSRLGPSHPVSREESGFQYLVRYSALRFAAYFGAAHKDPATVAPPVSFTLRAASSAIAHNAIFLPAMLLMSAAAFLVLPTAALSNLQARPGAQLDRAKVGT